MNRTTAVVFGGIAVLAGLLIYFFVAADGGKEELETRSAGDVESTAESSSAVDGSSNEETQEEDVGTRDERIEIRPGTPDREFEPEPEAEDPSVQNDDQRMPIDPVESESERRKMLESAFGPDGPQQCDVRCDCPQGMECQPPGLCMPAATPVYCCPNMGCPEGQRCMNPDGTPGICPPE